MVQCRFDILNRLRRDTSVTDSRTDILIAYAPLTMCTAKKLVGFAESDASQGPTGKRPGFRSHKYGQLTVVWHHLM